MTSKKDEPFDFNLFPDLKIDKESLKKFSNNGLAERIKKIRENYGFTLEEFGQCVSPPASKSIVWNWENKYVTPNKERLESIANLGHTSVEYLLTGKEDLSQDIGLNIEIDTLTDWAKKLDETTYKEFQHTLMNALGVVKIILERSMYWDGNLHDESEIDGHEIPTFTSNLALYKQINHNIFQIISPRNGHSRNNRLKNADELRKNIEALIEVNDSPAPQDFYMSDEEYEWYMSQYNESESSSPSVEDITDDDIKDIFSDNN
ncbi:helix-turn-helix domain-containing protein [Lactococcus lactis]|uniref:helix-turn-helix domain-containing protein n=1 Tax=Lactococcus lactis TaxID=1358 RepID=UPI000C9F0CDE|nr:helix-turn-helix transcriptional regulator [Lactococcus lactis]AUS70625.1 hypothetical protein LLG50_11340 [Lactococcus lactis subsp. lactis]